MKSCVALKMLSKISYIDRSVIGKTKNDNKYCLRILQIFKKRAAVLSLRSANRVRVVI